MGYPTREDRRKIQTTSYAGPERRVLDNDGPDISDVVETAAMVAAVAMVSGSSPQHDYGSHDSGYDSGSSNSCGGGGGGD